MSVVSEESGTACEATPARDMSDDARAVLTVSELRVSVRDRGRNAIVVNDVGLHVQAGELLAIVGESGAGKSLLCRALMGLLPHGASASGSIVLAGQETIGMKEPRWRQLRGRVAAFVFQDSTGSLNPTMTVGDQVIEAIRTHNVTSRRSARKMAGALFDALLLHGTQGLLRAYPHELSGGMQQRVSIAIAVACRPQLLIADEPTRSLDMVAQAKTMELFRHLQREMRMAIILVSHDLALVASTAARVAVMYAGRIVETLPAESLGHVRSPYTRALLDASAGRKGIPLQQPFEDSLTERTHSVSQSGCAYAPYCWRVDSVCLTETPPKRWESEKRMHMCWHPLSGQSVT